MRNLHRTLLLSTLILLALFAVSCIKIESPAPSAENTETPAADSTAAAPEAQAPAAEHAAAQPAASSAPAARPSATPSATPAKSTAATRPANTSAPAAASSAASGWGDSPSTPSRTSTAPAAPVLKTYTLPSGSTIVVRTTSTLSTKTVQQGASFAGSLAEPLTVDGTVIAERGANVTGRVVQSDDGGRIKGRAYIELALSSVRLVNGETASVQTAPFGEEAKSTKGKDAAKVGIASGIGAAIGAIAGGGKGAAIGAGVGAGAGTGAVLATKGDAAVIPAESLIRFRTQSPISVKLQ